MDVSSHVTLKKRKLTNKMQVILDAAESVFSEKGFHGARIDEIAKSANVSKALIYYYFKNKEMLFRAMITECFSDILKLKEQIMPPDEQPNEQHVLTFFKAMREQRKFLKIVLMELLRNGEWNMNLFEFMDDFSGDFHKKHQCVEESEKIKSMIEVFYFGTMAMAFFFSLEEKWNKYYGLDEEMVFKEFCEIIHKNKTIERFFLTTIN